MSAPDVTVRLQALDGTWETCGADRMIGVVPESEQHSDNESGPDKASFDLKRPVFAIWPDLGAFTPVEIEIGGVVVWDGFVGETPLQAAREQVINVQCEGWQYHLDHDVYERNYVHTKLTDWKDCRSASLEVDLATFTSAPQVQTGVGLISLVWPQGQATNGRAGVVLDMGPETKATRVVITWALSAGAANRAVYFGFGAISAGPTFIETIASATGAQSGTYSLTLPTPSRYVFLIHDANSHTPGADEAFKITSASVFASTAYESGGASVLHASTLVQDALERGTEILSGDYSEIAATSFAIPDFTMGKQMTPREVVEAANAYHNYIFKLLPNRRPSFQPRPSDATLELGAWSGADLDDTSANSGAEIYNRAVVEATGPDGNSLIVERGASQQPGVLAHVPESPIAENPSFTTNAEHWATAGGGSIARNTVAEHYRSAPGSGQWTAAAGATLSGAFSGTFKKGVTYTLIFYAELEIAKKCKVQFGLIGTDEMVKRAVNRVGGFGQYEYTWTPTANRTGVTMLLTAQQAQTLYIDDVTIKVAEPTLVDRRSFRRTKVLQVASAITETEGQQLADVFLQAHLTTPFKGSAAAFPGSIRRVLGGQPVHPSQLGLHTQELIRLGHVVDPDTGGIGRDATIAEVTYTHKDQKAAITLDDKRGNFDALLARLAVVQSAGS